MLERLAFYRDLVISECLPAVPGAAPGVADYLFAGLTAALGLLALALLVHGFRGQRRCPQPADQSRRARGLIELAKGKRMADVAFSLSP